MAIHSETAALTPTITVDSAAIKRAERVRLYLLRPEDFKKAISAARRTSFDRATASIPPVRDHLMIREGVWETTVTADYMFFLQDEHAVTVWWDEVAAWGLTHKDIMITKARDGRVIIPIAGVPDELVTFIRHGLFATKAPKRRIGAGGNVPKFSEARTGEKIVQFVLLGVGMLVLLLSVLILGIGALSDL